MSGGERHIVSFVAWLRPGALAETATRLRTRHAAECHQQAGVDKLAVAVELGGAAAISDLLQEVAGWPGVLNVQLVYHQCASAEALGEELCA